VLIRAQHEFLLEHHILASGCEKKDHRLEDMDSSGSDPDRPTPPTSVGNMYSISQTLLSLSSFQILLHKFL